ncbi:unnamed protein product [Sphagnum tenellum]
MALLMGELCVVCRCWVDLPCWTSIKFGWQWGAKKVAEFLLQAAKFSMVFVFGFGFGMLVFVLFFLKNALVNTGRRMPKGGGYVSSKKKFFHCVMHPLESCSLMIGVGACE